MEAHLQEPYNSIAERHSQRLAAKRKTYGRLGNAKLLLVCLCVVFIVLSIRNGALPPYIASLSVAFLLLVAAWIVQLRVGRSVRYHEGILRANGRYLDRIRGEWIHFQDNGQAYLEKDHPYARDLDIIGPQSLFQYINVAYTWHGRQAFVADLLHGGYAGEDAGARQAAIEELAGKHEFQNEMQYHTEQTKGSARIPEFVSEVCSAPPYRIDPWAAAIIRIVPVLATLLFFVGLVFELSTLRTVATVVIVVQVCVWLLLRKSINAYLRTVQRFPQVLGHYLGAMRAIRGETFTAPLLVGIQSSFAKGDGAAIRAMQRLEAIVGNIHIRYTPIFYFLANAFLLWDFRCILQLNRWKHSHADHFESWLQSLGTVESLMCFSGLRNVCTNTCYPVITPDSKQIHAQQIGHPLIPNDRRVTNDLSMDGTIFIISGSNMSGKTTFLRTVGMNLVLANAGAPVCAAQLQCDSYRVITSMRTTDNLSDGVSSFYAELTQIARIIQLARTDPNVFFLIDEIFKGTNSQDRLYGARAVLSELAARSAMGMISTHDLALCDMESDNERIRNYSFSEHYVQDEMQFEYALHRGRSKTTNGQYLMRRLGLLKDGGTD